MSSAKATTRTGDEQARGNKILFPAWLPQMARQRIGELRATLEGPDAAAGRGLLLRLAKNPVMRTEVWKKLPSTPRGREGDIIDWAFLAYTLFPILPRPWPTTKAKWREWAKHREKHSLLTNPAYLSQLAHQLWEEISKLKDDTERYWPSLWEGDRSIKLEPDIVYFRSASRVLCTHGRGISRPVGHTSQSCARGIVKAVRSFSPTI